MSSTDKLKIPLRDILVATDEFAEANIIGKGGYGLVYRGQSEQHGMLAIKRLIRVHGQGDHEYGMEVTLLSKCKHENLVSLIDYCGDKGEKILVYKYEANQSLDKFLHSKDLSWMRRLQICLGAARGLSYLHDETGSGHGIIHRDVKSSNILLDENWKAKISDFGLSKITLTNSADSVMFSAACGTLGYIDPQVLYGCGITQKSDVYSFGVVLYEVLFGKFVALPGDLSDGRFTVILAEKHYEEKTLDKMIFSDLKNEINSNSLSTYATIAYQCLKKDTKDRPTMSLVVKALEKALDYQQLSNRESFWLSSSSSGYLYDIYIIARYEMNYIVDPLCDALKREGFSIYKSNEQSPQTTNYDNLHVIKQSRSFIFFFSKTFAAEMNTVEKIMECVKERGNVVIPVFWNVHPSDVRERKGYLGEAMSIYVHRQSLANALIEATNVPGLDQSDFDIFSANPAKEAAAKIKRLLLEENDKSGNTGLK